MSVIGRRRLLEIGAGAALGLAGPGAAAAGQLWTPSGAPATSRAAAALADLGRAPRAQPSAKGARRLALRNLHTDERLDAAYWENGAYVPDVLAAVNRLLRDFRTGEAQPMSPALLDVLTDLQARTESRAAFQVVSGYRSAQTNAMLRERSAEVARRSLHMDGMAIDVYLEDVALDHLHQAALDLGRGGVGYYPSSHFIHVDVGPVRRWGGV